jgi:hypothetical protein
MVRHLHFGQGLRIHRLVLRDQIVGREQVSADRIDLVVAQRMRRRPRHGAADIVEQRGRIGPEIGYCFVRSDAVSGERRIADQHIARAALAVVAVALVAALVDIEFCAFGRRAAAWRQIGAIGQHAAIPGLYVGLGDQVAKFGVSAAAGATLQNWGAQCRVNP